MTSGDENRSGRGPAVVCEHLEVNYGETRAVDDVSFTVEPGQVFGLLGPNGAGKTSVIRALTTIIDPTAGRAEIAGLPISKPTAVRSVIGVLPESNGYPEAVTALDYLRYFGRLYGLTFSEAARRGKSLLNDAGLGSVAGQPIKTFSRGMRQRLGIARSLVNRPPVLFLDEPTLGLDPAGREDILTRLTEIASNDGAAVVLCSHLLDDVERVCDQIAILHKGRVVSSGTVPAVIAGSRAGNAVKVTVDPSSSDRAVALLSDHPAVAGLVASHPGRLEISLQESVRDFNGILSELISAGVSITAVEPVKARLSDAFLFLTSEGEAHRGP